MCCNRWMWIGFQPQLLSSRRSTGSFWKTSMIHLNGGSSFVEIFLFIRFPKNPSLCFSMVGAIGMRAEETALFTRTWRARRYGKDSRNLQGSAAPDCPPLFHWNISSGVKVHWHGFIPRVNRLVFLDVSWHPQDSMQTFFEFLQWICCQVLFRSLNYSRWLQMQVSCGKTKLTMACDPFWKRDCSR